MYLELQKEMEHGVAFVFIPSKSSAVNDLLTALLNKYFAH